MDCGLPAKIQVHRGYYRPEGVPPTVSLVSTDGSACKHACIGIYDDDTCNTCGSVGRPPTMAVACPWGTKACAGGALHGNASCVTGHQGHFCAECWTGWFRGASG